MSECDKLAAAIEERDIARADLEKVVGYNTKLQEEYESATRHYNQIINKLHAELHDLRLENSGQAARIEELKKGNEIITAAVCSGNSIEVERAIQERDAVIVEAKRTRPEPSRLEIAATLVASRFSCTSYVTEVKGDWIQYALKGADALIAASKEQK